MHLSVLEVLMHLHRDILPQLVSWDVRWALINTTFLSLSFHWKSYLLWFVPTHFRYLCLCFYIRNYSMLIVICVSTQYIFVLSFHRKKIFFVIRFCDSMHASSQFLLFFHGWKENNLIGTSRRWCSGSPPLPTIGRSGRPWRPSWTSTVSN